MLITTQGIVLRSIPYSESSRILRIYTLHAGLEGFILGGIGRPRSAKEAILQPLTRIDMVYYDKVRKGLRRVREISCREPYRSIPFDTGKCAIAMFVAELLSISMRENEPDPALFRFVEASLEELDSRDAPGDWFPLHFMVRLSRFLGFYPDRGAYRPGYCFSLAQGTYAASVPERDVPLGASLSAWLVNLQSASWEDLESRPMPRQDRMHLLDALVLYYELHLPQGPRMKSHKVLHETFA